ncbi:hypothetical protein ACSW9O_15425 (plasmid) [Clostridium perfringens]
MKITELELNKIYKPNNYEYTHNLYRMTNSGLEYKFEDDEWQKSDLSFNELFTYDFKEHQRKIDWTKVPKWTKILVRNYTNAAWKNAYFLNYKGDKEDYNLRATFCDKFTYDWTPDKDKMFKFYKIHPSVTIPEEWYKEERL